MFKISKIGILALLTTLFGSGANANDDGITSSVFVWHPNGDVIQASPKGPGMFYQACIHPQGEAVIFSGNTSGGPRIWKRNLSTNTLTALTRPNTASLHGVYSWDGRSIAFTSDMSAERSSPTFVVENLSAQGQPPAGAIVNIHIMDSDGGNIRQLTSGKHADQRPTFSPDGKTIIFVRLVGIDGKTYPTLWSIPSDGSGQAAPIEFSGSRWAYRPWYSQDETRIYFFTIDQDGRHRIASISAEGGVAEFLAADDEGRSHGPFADPDGSSLLMHSTRGPGDQHKIWEVPLAGGVPRQLGPPGFDSSSNVMHATRSINGIIAFDSF